MMEKREYECLSIVRALPLCKGEEPVYKVVFEPDGIVVGTIEKDFVKGDYRLYPHPGSVWTEGHLLDAADAVRWVEEQEMER